jgi:hypothetical protein
MSDFIEALIQSAGKLIVFKGKRFNGHEQIAILKRNHAGHTVICEFPGAAEILQTDEVSISSSKERTFIDAYFKKSSYLQRLHIVVNSTTPNNSRVAGLRFEIKKIKLK